MILPTIKAGLIAAVIAVSFSCKKSFLEIIPKGKLVAGTVADYNLLLNTSSLVSVSTDAHIILGEEVAAAEPEFSTTFTRTQRLFRYEAEVYDDGVTATEMTAPLQIMYIYNKVINEVGQATGGTEEQRKSIMAEAKGGRAFCNFLLINHYGKPYSATAANDPGFPIVTQANVTATSFTRASVKEMYDFIVKDLTEALPDLPAKTTFRMRMSKAAGEALLAKVYMFMGKFNEALPLLNNAFTHMAASDIPVRLYDYNSTFGPNGAFLPLGAFGPTLPLVTEYEESLYAKQTFNSFTFNFNELVLKPQASALFKPSDIRLKMFSTMPYPSGTPYPTGLLRKIGPLNSPIGLVVPELYLLRAECKARLNDLDGAVTDVETLRKNRMPIGDVAVPTSIATQQLPLIKFVLEERIREFAMQGFRWFDIRRLSVDPLFAGDTYSHELYSTAGAVTSYPLKPERMVLRFPIRVINENPGMSNNP